MTDNPPTKDANIPPRPQHQQQGYTTAHRPPPPSQHNDHYRPRYQPQQQQRYERTGSSPSQQERMYNGSQYRPRNTPQSTQRQQQQQATYRPSTQQQWRPESGPHNNYARKPQITPPSKETKSTADDADLIKSMQALSTNDTSAKAMAPQDEMADDNTVLECTATPLKLDDLQAIIEKYESMRGGCRIQRIDDTRALVVFGHASTAKRAWTENKSNDKIKIQDYRGPMDIIEDIPIVRKSALNQRARPTNMAAKRLIHGSLGLKAPANGTQRKTDHDAQHGKNTSSSKR